MSDLKISNLYKRYGNVEVLKDVNLDINSGEFVVFVGPSGCGKSTLLRTISGLESITSGTLEIGGRVVNDVAPSKRGIAMVFQSYALYPHMTVFDNMAYSLKLTRTPKDEIKRKVQQAADMLQLGPYLERLPKALSGGQRQRVAIGRAIVRNPQVFLFDEPLSNLDAALRVATRMEIAKLKESLPETTMVYVTHDQVEAMTLADRIVVLKDGVVMQVGTPMELYDQPQSLFVAGFIGSPKMNFLTGKNAATYNATTVGVRPEHMEIVPNGNGDWTGKVIYSEDLGSDSYIYVDIGEEEAVIVRQDGKTPYHSGDIISFRPKGSLYHRFDEAGAPLSANGVATPVKTAPATSVETANPIEEGMPDEGVVGSAGAVAMPAKPARQRTASKTEAVTPEAGTIKTAAAKKAPARKAPVKPKL
ncbi:multiple sugar transport system ATP-binding protein [Pelagibacterium luteolum]|uniref:Multiple sugar transport system ATP-binding protein n=1 Tax=Pelagibacterium luteolum TaxID=440168 RepID=A0A1G7U185_9HYPH|nr:multiple sugar transport system ATP-binding protein [Pelagibacterium luteolum]